MEVEYRTDVYRIINLKMSFNLTPYTLTILPHMFLKCNVGNQRMKCSWPSHGIAGA